MPRYTSRGIVYSLVIARAALQDLADIGRSDPDTEDLILTLLQEANGSQTILESLTVKDFGLARDQAYHVDVWVAQQQQGRNLWRLKIWDLEDLGIRYRIVYALDPRISRYFVLAVLPRDFDYDERHPRVQQLLATYDGLGIPSFR
ncbi:MAG: hypothetical protein AB7U95_00310 [Reyranella sp.]